MKIKAANTILYCEKWLETVDIYRNVLTERCHEARTSIDSNQRKGITISLQVADIDRTRIELIEVGITPTPIKEVWGSKAMYIHDPEGNRLEFWMGRAKV
jgi:uncharacterized glyoxalase superfamily protein PhnB